MAGGIIYRPVPQGALRDKLTMGALDFLVGAGEKQVAILSVDQQNDDYLLVFSSADGEGSLRATVTEAGIRFREV